jgi:hypothetical protein
MEGRDVTATVYERAKLEAGNRIPGPAIVIEMDSTTVILPRHHGRVDAYGNILIYPDSQRAKRGTAARSKPAGARKKSAPPRKGARTASRRVTARRTR